jgi:Caspase domain
MKLIGKACRVLFALIAALHSLASVSQSDHPDVDKVFSAERSNWEVFERSMGIAHQRFALVVGVSRSKGFDDIPQAYQDAIKVKDFLLLRAGFDEVHVATNQLATVERISQYMESLPDRMGRDDAFLFYFSGHGIDRNTGEEKVGYLVLSAAGKNGYHKMISMNNVAQWDRLLADKRHVLFVLDSCFSGLAGVTHKGRAEHLRLDQLKKKGHHLLTAGSANQKSVALPGRSGSLFTDAFLKGAEGAADAFKDGFVSLNELTEYVTGAINHEAAVRAGINMTPKVSALRADNEGEFFFVNHGRMGMAASINAPKQQEGKTVLKGSDEQDPCQRPDPPIDPCLFR